MASTAALGKAWAMTMARQPEPVHRSSADSTASGILDPGREAVFQQFGEVGARHDDARIDMEAELAEPGFVQQVGRRQAMHHALLQALQQRVALAAGQAGVEKGSSVSRGRCRVASRIQTASSQALSVPWPKCRPASLKRLTAQRSQSRTV
jgi:hypothetical protein